MREINGHKVNQFNRKHVRVAATDLVGAAEPNNSYRVTTLIEAETSDQETEIVDAVELNFQNGPGRPNGITDEALLAVVIDRLQGRQRVGGSREVALAITKGEEMLLWLGKYEAGRNRDAGD